MATVQQLLAANGFFTGPIDGKLGPLTTQSIRAFQRQNFLPIDGHISARLLSELAANLVDQIPGQLGPGGVETEVGRIALAQRHLARLGLEPGPADGRYGPYTRQAIRDFQLRNGMAPTGEIDDELLEALASADPSNATNSARGADSVGFDLASRRARRAGLMDSVATQLDRPGLRSDLDIGKTSELIEASLTLRVIADGRVVSAGRDTEAVRLNGLQVGSAVVANQSSFSYDSPMVNELVVDSIGQYADLALSWSGFLVATRTGQYDFVVQTEFADAANGNQCDVALMFHENQELVAVIKRRVTTARATDRANLFLDEGLHAISIWVQCKEVVGVRRFRTNLLMRGPGFQVAQPIPDSLLLTAEDVETVAHLLESN